MDARDFLTIADHFRASLREAERRTSIGRSYYALFNVVLGTLAAKGAAFHQSADDHRDLVAYLTKVGHRDTGPIGQALNDLRAHRNTADYKMSDPISVKTTEFVYEKAKRAIERFDAIPSAEINEIARKIQAIP